MKVLIIFAALFAFSSRAYPQPLKTKILHFEQSPAWFDSLDVRVGIQRPDTKPIGDIFYFTGFGDRFDNHRRLFNAWAANGFRVISFDYPSQGKTTGTSLNLFTFKMLAQLAMEIELATREDRARPFLISGCSTGGLLAMRMLQSDRFAQFRRPVSGAIFFAPGISLSAPVGPISSSTFAFDGLIKLNSYLAQHERYPKVRTLVFAGEEGDVFANSKNLSAWVAAQNAQNGASIEMAQDSGARQEMAAAWAKSLVGGDSAQAISRR